MELNGLIFIFFEHATFDYRRANHDLPVVLDITWQHCFSHVDQPIELVFLFFRGESIHVCNIMQYTYCIYIYTYMTYIYMIYIYDITNILYIIDIE